MNNYENEHPYRMKIFEIAVESLMGIASMLVCSWISDKLKEHDEREKREEACREAENAQMLNRSVVAATTLTKVYGALWMDVPEGMAAYNSYMDHGMFDNDKLDEIVFVESE